MALIDDGYEMTWKDKDAINNTFPVPGAQFEPFHQQNYTFEDR